MAPSYADILCESTMAAAASPSTLPTPPASIAAVADGANIAAGDGVLIHMSVEGMQKPWTDGASARPIFDDVLLDNTFTTSGADTDVGIKTGVSACNNEGSAARASATTRAKTGHEGAVRDQIGLQDPLSDRVTM